MTENDKLEGQKLSERQLKAIPHIIASPTYDEGCKKAKVSRNAFYEWLRNPAFKEELKKQRKVVIEESLEILKQNITEAVDSLVSLLKTTDSDNLKRLICNDIINYTLKAKEFEELEKRILKLEEAIKGVKQ